MVLSMLEKKLRGGRTGERASKGITEQLEGLGFVSEE